MKTSALVDILRDLHTVLGFGVHLYDSKCRGIMHFIGESEYCRLIHTASTTETICRNFDTLCFRIAAETGDVYSTCCPFGIYTAVCPILQDGELFGFLMLSRVIPDAEEAKEVLLKTALQHLPQQASAISARIQALPKRSREQLNALSSILRYTCQFIAQNGLFPTKSLTLGALAKAYIHENLQNRLTLEDICEHLHYSRSALTAAFRREFGMSIVTYINRERLNLAAKLLKNCDDSIADIALLCGFSNAEYFSNLFKKAYSCSPLAYRQKQKKAEA